MRAVSDAERRARLVERHGLGHRYATVEEATRAMTAWHATEAATVHLAIWARVRGVTVGDVEGALYAERSIVKQLAMRRTLFGFPRDLLPAVWGSAAARVAAQQHRQLLKVVPDEAWAERAYAATLDVLADGEPRTSAELNALVPGLDDRVSIGGPNTRWGAEVPVGRWVLTTLGARGEIQRAANAGHWRRNAPTWTTTEHWLGEPPRRMAAGQGYAELVACWLWTFGPGTETDIVWWLGATKGAVRKALAEVGAAQVGLEPGGTGWVLPDDPFLDLTSHDEADPIAALLPTLDPTVMGWKERGFYLDAADVAYLFDTNGNAGNTAWWGGRIVGCWLQDDDARVRVVLRGDPGDEARRALDAEAERLTDWLDGVVVTNVYASSMMRQARLS